MAPRKYNQARKLSPTELLYAFTGWLTTRKKPIVMGRNYDAAPVGQLLAGFIDANKLPPPRDTYPNVKKPLQLDDLTNNYPLNAVAEPPLSPDKAIGLFLAKLNEMSVGDQDVTIAGLLNHLREGRARRLQHVRRAKDNVDQDHDETQESVWNLDRIARGDFYVIKPAGPVTLKAQP